MSYRSILENKNLHAKYYSLTLFATDVLRFTATET